MRVPLSDEEFRMWGEWLAEGYGLRYGPEKRDMLRARLEPRRAALGVESFEQLLFHVKFHPERGEELDRLLPHLTNNESYFCREQGTLQVVRDEALPALAAQAGPAGQVRLLSAACAAGEEAYTLAVMARESGLFGAPRSVRVTGVDLDARALERARAARYGEHAFRGTGAAFRERWFRRDGEGWEVLPEVRAAVAFREANLADPAWSRGLPPQHLILCRNVLIYFDEEGIRRAAEGLYRALAPGGWLLLGHAESLRRVPVPFRVERRPGAIVYRRPETEEAG